jgi:uncharacterized protein (TIGR02466 family)
MNHIFDIFPTPVYYSNIFREWTSEENQFFEKLRNITVPNLGRNELSDDRFVLNNPICDNIKKFIEANLHTYMQEIIRPKFDVKFQITQSWLNWTSEGQAHHKHNHPNSIVSGVLYINALNDSINFYNETFNQLRIPAESNNQWNSVTWPFSVNTGDLLIFPSSLTHGVDFKKGSNVRCSLAFNTFVKGTLGSYDESTLLQI